MSNISWRQGKLSGEGPRRRTSGPAASGAPQRSERREPAQQRKTLRRLRQHGVLPVLVGLILVTTLATVTACYLSLRADATTAAQDRTAHELRTARDVLAQQGPSLVLRDGRLLAGVDGAARTLNDDTSVVDRVRNLTGDYVTIYQIEGPSLTAIATNVPRANAAPSSRALGDHLGGDAYAALLGNCGPISSAACHQGYSGIATLGGSDYVTTFEPLTDVGGNFVGAIAVARPLSTVTSSVLQFTIIVLLVGLLAALLALVIGNWLLGARSEQRIEELEARLAEVAAAACELERLGHAQRTRAQRQERLARSVGEQAHQLEALSGTVGQAESTLRDATGSIWAEMSQPGAPDPSVALQLSQKTAVVAARVGASADEVRERSRQLVVLMNQIIAEGSVLGEDGAKAEQHAGHLREAIERVEIALGERLVARQYDMPGEPVVPRFRRATQRMRSLFGKPAEQPKHETAAHPARSSSHGNVSGQRQRGPAGDGSRLRGAGVHGVVSRPLRSTGHHPTLGSMTGQHPAAPSTGKVPRVSRSGPDASTGYGRMRFPDEGEDRAGTNALPSVSASQSSPQAGRSQGSYPRYDRQPGLGVPETGHHPRAGQQWQTGRQPTQPRRPQPPSVSDAANESHDPRNGSWLND